MKNLKKKFGKYALSHQQANSFVGGQDYSFCCVVYTQGIGTSRCSQNYNTIVALCTCGSNQMCTEIEKIYI